jgi:hypothetical protein
VARVSPTRGNGRNDHAQAPQRDAQRDPDELARQIEHDAAFNPGYATSVRMTCSIAGPRLIRVGPPRGYEAKAGDIAPPTTPQLDDRLSYANLGAPSAGSISRFGALTSASPWRIASGEGARRSGRLQSAH